MRRIIFLGRIVVFVEMLRKLYKEKDLVDRLCRKSSVGDQNHKSKFGQTKGWQVK